MSPLGWIVLVSLVSVLGLAVVGAWSARRLRYRSCPTTGRRVWLTVRADSRTGWWDDVESCSGLGRADRVQCGKACVRCEVD